MARRREAGTPGRAPDAGRDPSHRRRPAPGRLSTRAVGVWERGSRRQVTDARMAQMARTIGGNTDAPAAEPESTEDEAVVVMPDPLSGEEGAEVPASGETGDESEAGEEPLVGDPTPTPTVTPP